VLHGDKEALNCSQHGGNTQCAVYWHMHLVPISNHLINSVAPYSWL
jgi:hypothetical protein